MPTTLEAIVPTARPALAACLISVHGDPLAPTGAEEAGGQNVYVREVARALAERGIQVDVFTRGRDVASPQVVEAAGFRVIRLPAGPAGFIPRTELFPYLPEFVRGVDRWARREGRRYDVLHTNYWHSGWVGLQLAAIWDRPQVHTHHSLGAVKYAGGSVPPSARERLEVEATIGRQAARVVATSPQEVDALARLYPGRARTAIIPCGVGPMFRPRAAAACREALGLPQDRPIVGYVGRFDPAKGIDTLVGALALLEPARRPLVVFAGGYDPAAHDAREFWRIQDLVDDAGLGAQAVFLGRMDHADLAVAYGAMDLVAVPSRYESFGLVAVEAMGCGRPVVASEVGGLRYTVVHRETGLLVPVGDQLAFAGAIGTLVEDPGLRAAMGAAGARLVRRVFSWEAVAAQLEALYRDVSTSRAAKAHA